MTAEFFSFEIWYARSRFQDDRADIRRIDAMEKFGALKFRLHETEERLLAELRTIRRGIRGTVAVQGAGPQLTTGQRIADAVAATMGSWTFIIIQSAILMV